MKSTTPSLVYTLYGLRDMRSCDFEELNSINKELEKFLRSSPPQFTKKHLQNILNIIDKAGGYLHTDVDDIEEATDDQIRQKWIPINLQLGDECMISIVGYSFMNVYGDWERIGI